MHTKVLRMRLGSQSRVSTGARPVAIASPRLQPAHLAHSLINIVSRVAALEQAETSEGGEAASRPVDLDTTNVEDLELDELDRAQEQLLAWVMYKEQEEQDEELDEMVDYDEYGDEEYEELYDTVDALVEEAAGVQLSMGDSVVGTVYEVDDEAAYVDIGHKGSGVVPLSLCSSAKLKSVRAAFAVQPQHFGTLCAVAVLLLSPPMLLPPCCCFLFAHESVRVLQPLEVLRPGMKREFTVVDTTGDFGEVILALAVEEVSCPLSTGGRLAAASLGGLL